MGAPSKKKKANKRSTSAPPRPPAHAPPSHSPLPPKAPPTKAVLTKGKGKAQKGEGRVRRTKIRDRNNWQEYDTGHKPSNMGPCGFLPALICRHCGQEGHWGNECDLHKKDPIAARELKEATGNARAKAEAQGTFDPLWNRPSAVINSGASHSVLP